MTTPVRMSKTKTGADFLSALPAAVVGAACGSDNNLFGLFRTRLTGFFLSRRSATAVIGLYATALRRVSCNGGLFQFYF